MDSQPHSWKSLTVHAVALSLGNVLAIVVGHSWDQWVHLTRPFAAQIPMGSLLAVALFSGWYHVASPRFPGPASRADWFRLSLLALVIGPALFLVASLLLADYHVSLGRLLTFIVFQLVIIPFALVAAHAFKDVPLGRVPGAKAIFALGFGIALAIGIVAAIEGIFSVLEKNQPPGPEKVYEGDYLTDGVLFNYDPVLGIRASPDAEVPCRLVVDGEEIWDVTYRTDAFERRRTTHPAPEQGERFALFFGCSYLFAEGCEDDETIPSLFSEKHPEYRSYNYGFPGYGPQQMLARLEEGMRPGEITESQGTAFFVYLEDIHEPRACGDMSVVNGWAPNYPCYEVGEEGEIFRAGTFTTARPWRSRFFGLLKKSTTARYLKINFPAQRSPEDYALVAKIFERSRQLLRENVGADDLTIVLFPVKHEQAHRSIVPYLEESGIPYLDYTHLFKGENAFEWTFGKDGHPNPEAQRRIAESVAADYRNALAPPLPKSD